MSGAKNQGRRSCCTALIFILGGIKNPQNKCKRPERTVTTLTELIVLSLDCQTTGATPEKGRLLEIGWMTGSAGLRSKPQPPAVHAHLIKLSPEAAIPRAVQQVTGITDSILEDAPTEEAVWQQLFQKAADIAARNNMERSPTVIHYARFETPFLRDLHQRYGPQTPFPFHIICTHAIAARLLPTLPRRGLRALAGFWGHTLPEQRRSGDHARATLVIWQNLVALLSSRKKVETVAQLEQWLSAPAIPKTTRRAYPMNSSQYTNLPDLPGVYRMRGINGDLLYVGKANSLKKRVKSYFRSKAAHAEHILEMLTQAREIDVAPTASALEAAVLEVEEIKRWSPPYNKALRDQGYDPVFFTRDLTQYALTADSENCLGPLPQHQSGDALAAFGVWSGQGCPLDKPGLEIASNMLRVPQAFAIDDTSLSAGLALFGDHYGEALAVAPPSRALQGLGIQYWLEDRQARAIEEMDGDQDPSGLADEPEDLEYRWTPEGVEKTIKARIRHWAHLLRRARWFCLLSESSLAWFPIDRSGSLNLIIVTGRQNF